MIGDVSPVSSNQAYGESLPAPRFDARASASARPVEPIQPETELVHKRIFKGWHQKFHSLSFHLGTQSRALALVVVVGLITGAVGGVLMVNAAKTHQQPIDRESVVKTEVSESSAQQVEKLDAFAAALGGAGLQKSAPSLNRARHSRVQSRSNRPRAYRVAIIR